MKHRVDLDEDALSGARAALGTPTIKDTINTALRMAAVDEKREQQIAASTHALVKMRLSDADREQAWR